MSDNSQTTELEVMISNRQGLHARPVLRFVDIACQFPCSIRVHKNEQSVDGKSPMEMMLLEATQGTALRLVATGEKAKEAVDALAQLIREKFGED